MLFSSKTEDDWTILSDMLPILDELLGPLRFLADLDAVWDDLPQSKRDEIENSRVYRERDHERLVEAGVLTLRKMAEQLKGFKHRKIRLEILEFLDRCREYEPDRVKVLQARIRVALEE